ncbi:MAG: CDGSH iron-sulfur domain-containing protein [Candidatus Kapabacteria bacterium]|nr:CDGSH iron-sulfur domain-containing protein [Candidatus Kapabacteria bacterium]
MPCARTWIPLELEAGTTYLWCACGRSASQPFCDGSHRATTIQPVLFTVPVTKRYPICLCKYTQAPPLCDGAHRSLPVE